MPTGTYTEEVVCVQRTGTLYDVLELILDRGMVIDVFIRVSLVGIEILKIDARIVVASVDTYLRFAEACNRLDLEFDRSSTTVPELLGGVGGGGSAAGGMAAGIGKKKAKTAVKGVGEKVKHAVGVGDDEEEEEREEQESRPRRRTAATGARSRRRPASSEED
ncbi:gas vesicle protein GvpJ [Streptomyces antimycoticus]|uniref:Gas vesicle protein A n=3 Tax=Streptomyces TaxID=1883 RepID=A0ABD5JJN7_9ACTN|nr:MULTISPECIES: gas vesicle protein GvpJ [Streptomyces]MEE4588265.1 gas vesicle protein GvpJ [Streptomyces sp. DSM 41602]AJZ82489.1 gas vesicle structural protein GvpA [Streptomyces sp. AgN23]KUL59322.1 gas vesicle protein [Streptomyces violaceusniger]RSS38391.1 gas vesicle structural protein GvpA [Streptomyces sp. WAC05858]WJD97603.1 gas vesicle protein GvpJ [Streptomyces antimycoticus]